MTTNGIDIVEQLRGRMKFFQVGDPVRRDMQTACEEIGELRAREMLMQALIDEAEKRLDGVTGDGLSRVPSLSVVNAASVGAWLDREGIKLLPWQRKRLGLAPPPREQDLAPVE